MSGIYFPKYSILLIDGKQIFANAFTCFLENIYQLSLYTKTQNNITIPEIKETKDLLLSCLINEKNSFLKIGQNFIKENNIYCNTVVCFNLSYLEDNLEIFNYLDKDAIYKIVKKFIKQCKKVKLNFFINNSSFLFKFKENQIYTEVTISAKLQETINIISFNLS